MKQYVVYLRVSTEEQGKSGLGLEAQQRDIDLFLSNYSDVPYEVLATFTDILSGKNADRPELGKAIALSKKTGAEMLVAKLDRLSRNVAFIANLLEDKRLTFRVASMPHADKFSLHIYAALAEQEREFISLRTKAALRAAKGRGTKLGGLRPGTAQRNEGAKAIADSNAKSVASVVVPLRKAGASLRAIADALNNASMPTPRGGSWGPSQVKYTLDRLAD